MKMTHFKSQDHTGAVLEIICNQLQLAARQAAYDKNAIAGEKQGLNKQITALQSKILEQRNELGILVDGV